MSAILYCRIGWMDSYCGTSNDKLVNGGAYNKDNVGYEIYNFLPSDNTYYGFVEAGINKGIRIENLGTDKNAEFLDDILVVWYAKSDTSAGQRVVGWYRNARVYRSLQIIPENDMDVRSDKQFHFYNIVSDEATLVPSSDRHFLISGSGQSNIWYGNDEMNENVRSYIDSYDNGNDNLIKGIDKGTENLEGYEKDALVKTRVNQSKFRKMLEDTECKCRLCGINNSDLLVASHIKPWSQSNPFEKVDPYNGLLLCAMHDRLFDKGYISFDDTGNIMISAELSEVNQIFSNVRSDMKIDVEEGNLPYLKYHREKIFRD